MTPKRKFYRNGFQHIFQISVDRGLLFYTESDCIVFFTILCYAAVKYHVRITALCIMLNHFHIQARFACYSDMELFINELTSIFALMYNKRYHRRGQLFKKSYGSAPKRSESDIIDNLAYVLNNPVPKSAADKALSYRWNFLAYMESGHPFSQELDKTGISDSLRKSMRIVETQHSKGKYLNYQLWESLSASLDEVETKQIIDYTIALYNVIDYSWIKARWGTLERFSEMLSLVKGSEYDAEEDFSKENYSHYDQINSVIKRFGYDLERVRFDTESFRQAETSSLRWEIVRTTQATADEIDKYFHRGVYSRRVAAK